MIALSLKTLLQTGSGYPNGKVFTALVHGPSMSPTLRHGERTPRAAHRRRAAGRRGGRPLRDGLAWWSSARCAPTAPGGGWRATTIWYRTTRAVRAGAGGGPGAAALVAPADVAAAADPVTPLTSHVVDTHYAGRVPGYPRTCAPAHLNHRHRRRARHQSQDVKTLFGVRYFRGSGIRVASRRQMPSSRPCPLARARTCPWRTRRVCPGVRGDRRGRVAGARVHLDRQPVAVVTDGRRSSGSATSDRARDAVMEGKRCSQAVRRRDRGTRVPRDAGRSRNHRGGHALAPSFGGINLEDIARHAVSRSNAADRGAAHPGLPRRSHGTPSSRWRPAHAAGCSTAKLGEMRVSCPVRRGRQRGDQDA